MPVPHKTFAFAFTILLTAGSACAPAPANDVEVADQECEPLQTRQPNATHLEATFDGQTRACGVDSDVDFEVTVVATGLEHPWAVEPLPEGGFLVTERPGRMRLVASDGTVGPPLSGVPEVSARNQGGLLDVALSPDFESSRMIYWSYSEPRGNGENATSVARGVLSEDGRAIEDVEVILRTTPAYDGGHHFGSRLVFTPDGKLFVTLGDRSRRPIRDQAQDLDSHIGKILRINPDGSVPSDNPFVDTEGARPEIWSYGHRNVQAATLDPEGRLWEIEHGPRGGDELNLVEAGVNYGWPIQTYGEQYSGRPVPNAEAWREGVRQPVYYWDPVIAPSGAEWYTGDAFPDWQGSLFVGALAQERLVRLETEPFDWSSGTEGPRPHVSDLAHEAPRFRVTAEEHLLTDRGQRIRDVRQGPDGALYVVTDEGDGELWRIAPSG